MAYLSIKNYCKSFSNLEVLKGVDVEVEKGEIVSIIGPSGSGKSTLLRSINFLETPDKGTMTLDGELLFDATDAVNYNEKTLREKRLSFGLVFQSFNLFPQYTVAENIALAPKLLLKDKLKQLKKQLKEQKLPNKEIKEKLASFKEESKSDIEKDVDVLLDKVGLTDKKFSFPCELSGGQCQRVAIARALALKPKVLCFDEPTSALDPELTGEVLKVIRSLKGEDRTMIIVTHEMGFAKSVSDKIIFIHNGLVAESGDPKTVLENPKSEVLKHFLANVSNKEENFIE